MIHTALWDVILSVSVFLIATGTLGLLFMVADKTDKFGGEDIEDLFDDDENEI